MEDIIAKDEASGVIADEILAYYEGLGESIGGWLLCVGEVYAVVGAISEEALETWEVLWGGDYEDIPYSGKHECGDGVIYHRLVEDWKELL